MIRQRLPRVERVRRIVNCLFGGLAGLEQRLAMNRGFELANFQKVSRDRPTRQAPFSSRGSTDSNLPDNRSRKLLELFKRSSRRHDDCSAARPSSRPFARQALADTLCANFSSSRPRTSKTEGSWLARIQQRCYFFVSRQEGGATNVKIISSSPVVVLMSWCRLTILIPVAFSTMASIMGRAVSTR